MVVGGYEQELADYWHERQEEEVNDPRPTISERIRSAFARYESRRAERPTLRGTRPQLNKS